MDVRAVLKDGPGPGCVEVTGWLVNIDEALYLLEENLCENYNESMKIRIAERSIIYALCGAILPLGGGESFVFHEAKLTGIIHINPTPEIRVESLYIKERGQTDLSPVDISKSNLDKAKKRYEAALKYDFFKEMGDH